MAQIALEGMAFYGYHGFYEEERKVGTTFIVDVYVDANASMAASTDDLAGTVNYETIYTIVRFEMRHTSQLLEHVAQRIMSKIRGQFSNVKGVRVKISKLGPPLGGRVDRASVELSS